MHIFIHIHTNIMNVIYHILLFLKRGVRAR